jgi:hypothetical protein
MVVQAYHPYRDLFIFAPPPGCSKKRKNAGLKNSSIISIGAPEIIENLSERGA